MIRLIERSDFKISLWKNGKGTTRQIAIYPENSSVEKNDFFWRLSQAEVQNSNSFSLFPECERQLTVLSGAGLLLNNLPLTPEQVHIFSGEQIIECELIDNQPVIDLGIIYKKNLVQAQFKILEIKDSVKLELIGPTHFFYLLSGTQCLIEQSKLTTGNILQVDHEVSIHIQCEPSIKLIHIGFMY